MKIMWGITGAGDLLKESLEELERISYENEVTIIFSRSGREVIQLYGYNNWIHSIVNNNSHNKIVYDEDESYSYPLSGKLTHQRYDLIIIAPTTANTVAKIVHGVADTLITNVVAQAGKGEIPTLILPTDKKEGKTITHLPPYIDKKLCQLCKKCDAKINCPTDAINPPNINTKLCIGCKKCEANCKYDAVITDKKISLYIRHIDVENTKKLDSIENITTVYSINELKEKIENKN